MTEKNKAVRRVEKLLQKQERPARSKDRQAPALLYAVRILPAEVQIQDLPVC